MGWFTRKQATALPPDELREALFEAARAQDTSRLRKLVDGHHEAITEHFPSWQKVPEALRGDPARVNHYAAGLIGVAAHCAQHGDPSLMARLQGPPADNPLLRWEQALRSAQESIGAGRHAQAEPQLREHVASGRNLSGTGVDRYLPITIGLLGQCRFHQGDAAEAVTLFDEALAICRRTQDVEGEIAYLSSLHEAHRWLGHHQEAISLAGELAERYDGAGDQDRGEGAAGGGSDRRHTRSAGALPLRAEALIKVGAKSAAEVVARAGLERNPDVDVRTRLLVTLSQAVKPSERRALLDEAIALDGNRTAAAMARLMARVDS